MTAELIVSIISIIISIIIGILQITITKEQKLITKQIQETNLKIDNLEISIRTKQRGIIGNSNAGDIRDNKM